MEMRMSGVARVPVARKAVVEHDAKRAALRASRARARARPAECACQPQRSLPVAVHRYDVDGESERMLPAEVVRLAAETVGDADAVHAGEGDDVAHDPAVAPFPREPGEGHEPLSVDPWNHRRGGRNLRLPVHLGLM